MKCFTFYIQTHKFGEHSVTKTGNASGLQLIDQLKPPGVVELAAQTTEQSNKKHSWETKSTSQSTVLNHFGQYSNSLINYDKVFIILFSVFLSVFNLCTFLNFQLFMVVSAKAKNSLNTAEMLPFR